MLYLQLDVKYMLILRTKGGMFQKLPIIPLFNVSSHQIKWNFLLHKWVLNFQSLSPSFECLKYIHQILHGYWLNNKRVLVRRQRSH